MSMLIVSKFIKNINMPICKNCAHYKLDKSLVSEEFTRCTKFGEMDIITGEITYDYAKLVRLSKSKCGINGSFFKEKCGQTNLDTIHKMK